MGQNGLRCVLKVFYYELVRIKSIQSTTRSNSFIEQSERCMKCRLKYQRSNVMKKFRIVLAMLVFALILSGCSNTGLGQQVESKDNVVINQHATDYDTLVTALKINGYSPEEIIPTQGDTDHSFFSVPTKGININGGGIFIYEFSDNDTAISQSKTISNDGSQIGHAQIEWIDHPHFYLQGKIIVGYIGKNKTLLSDLSKILGEPITNTIETK